MLKTVESQVLWPEARLDLLTGLYQSTSLLILRLHIKSLCNDIGYRLIFR